MKDEIIKALVKPLEWRNMPCSSSRADVYIVKPSHGQGPQPFFMARASNILGWFDDVSAAQAAAEADYRARIAAALDMGKIAALVAEFADLLEMVETDNVPLGAKTYEKAIAPKRAAITAFQVQP